MSKFIDEDFAKNLIEVIKENTNSKIKLINDYSGRFMFGKLCFGIIGDLKQIEIVLNEVFRKIISKRIITEENKEEIFDLHDKLLKVKEIDNMGKQHIIYFPGWQLPETIKMEE